MRIEASLCSQSVTQLLHPVLQWASSIESNLRTWFNVDVRTRKLRDHDKQIKMRNLREQTCSEWLEAEMLNSESDTRARGESRDHRDSESRPEFMRQESYTTNDFTITADVVYIEPDRLAIEEQLHAEPSKHMNPPPSSLSNEFRRLPSVNHQEHETSYSRDVFFAKDSMGWEDNIVNEQIMEASLHNPSYDAPQRLQQGSSSYHPQPVPKRRDILTVTAPGGVLMSKRANSTSPNHNFKIYGDYDSSPNESQACSFHITPHRRRETTSDVEEHARSPDRRIFDMVRNHRGNLRPDVQRPSIVPPLMLDSIEKLN
eukprot:749442-Hanusia_phi.AAC.1